MAPVKVHTVYTEYKPSLSSSEDGESLDGDSLFIGLVIGCIIGFCLGLLLL